MCGGNPKKTKREHGIPETLKAAVRAEGPGMGLTKFGPNFSKTALTNFAPGSEIPGTPESETREMFFPCFRRFKTRDILLFPECS